MDFSWDFYALLLTNLVKISSFLLTELSSPPSDFRFDASYGLGTYPH